MFLCFFFLCSRWLPLFFFFFSSRRRHTRSLRDWSSDVCSSDLDVDGATVLVTEFIQGFKTLLAWLESKAKLPPTESALTPPAASSPASAPAPGDFTRMFGADELAKVDQESPPVPPSPAPGGFTAFFGAVAAEPPTPSPSVDEPAQQSSDVPPARTDAPDANRRPVVRWRDEPAQKPDDSRAKPVIRWNAASPAPPVPRSEERRVGKECRSRWSP